MIWIYRNKEREYSTQEIRTALKTLQTKELIQINRRSNIGCNQRSNIDKSVITICNYNNFINPDSYFQHSLQHRDEKVKSLKPLTDKNIQESEKKRNKEQKESKSNPYSKGNL